jgi:UDP-glucose 4-epimerase
MPHIPPAPAAVIARAMRVLVTGGAGYVGSVLVEELVRAGHAVAVYDDLSKGHRDAVIAEATFVQGDLLDARAIGKALDDHRAEAVVHMAAQSLVGESVSDPAKYYKHNVVGSLVLLDAMIARKILRFVFSSTAAVYGNPVTQPIREDAALAPTNPYGETKAAIEAALRWNDGAYGLRSISLRYFNAAGASDRCGERHDPETHLIPIVLDVARGLRPFVPVFGDDYPTPDGTCIRDYVHVVDLARAHVLALDALSKGAATTSYNLGCGGAGFSVREVIATAERVTRKRIATKIEPRRAGDPPVLVASSDAIRAALGWEPRARALDGIVESAWRFVTSMVTKAEA